MLKTACKIGLKAAFTVAAAFTGYAGYLATCQWYIEPALQGVDLGAAATPVALAIFASKLASPFLAGYAGYKVSDKVLKNIPA